MLHQRDAAYDEGYFAVLYHDMDASCLEAIQAYRPLLRPEAANTLLDWPLNDVVHAWENRVATRKQERWLADLRLCYLDLKASEAAWDAYRRETAK